MKGRVVWMAGEERREWVGSRGCGGFGVGGCGGGVACVCVGGGEGGWVAGRVGERWEVVGSNMSTREEKRSLDDTGGQRLAMEAASEQ